MQEFGQRWESSHYDSSLGDLEQRPDVRLVRNGIEGTIRSQVRLRVALL